MVKILSDTSTAPKLNRSLQRASAGIVDDKGVWIERADADEFGR